MDVIISTNKSGSLYNTAQKSHYCENQVCGKCKAITNIKGNVKKIWMTNSYKTNFLLKARNIVLHTAFLYDVEVSEHFKINKYRSYPVLLINQVPFWMLTAVYMMPAVPYLVAVFVGGSSFLAEMNFSLQSAGCRDAPNQSSAVFSHCSIMSQRLHHRHRHIRDRKSWEKEARVGNNILLPSSNWHGPALKFIFSHNY